MNDTASLAVVKQKFGNSLTPQDGPSSAQSVVLVAKLCSGTHIRETLFRAPLPHPRRVAREREFRPSPFPNRVWQREPHENHRRSAVGHDQDVASVIEVPMAGHDPI